MLHFRCVFHTHACRHLQEDVVNFINKIAAIVHPHAVACIFLPQRFAMINTARCRILAFASSVFPLDRLTDVGRRVSTVISPLPCGGVGATWRCATEATRTSRWGTRSSWCGGTSPSTWETPSSPAMTPPRSSCPRTAVQAEHTRGPAGRGPTSRFHPM